MADPENPNNDQSQPPASDGFTSPAVPTPPPSPYEQPPLPGEAPQPAPMPQQPYAAPPMPQQAYDQAGYAQPFVQPTQPYSQAPQPPYGQTPQQPYVGGGQPYAAPTPQPPYPGSVPPSYPGAPQQPFPGAQQYHYANVPPQPKKKVWPWVLGACLAVLLLGIGGCVSCVAAISSFEKGYERDYPYNDYDYRYNTPDIAPDTSTSSTYTLNEIKDAFDAAKGTVIDGRGTPGVYEVGAGKDLEPGMYYLEGSQTEECNYYTFTSTGADDYSLNDGVVYFGNYFMELKAGDAVVFLANDSFRFYPVAKASFSSQAPYQSGLYRVGTDLPAGTYTITTQDNAAAVAENECAAFVMKDLEFNNDSVTQRKYVVRGGTQTVTVKDGDYLELYAVTAKPADNAA